MDLLNEEENLSITDSAYSRLKYTGIDIEKIIDKVITNDENEQSEVIVFDSNVMVEPGEKVTYKLTIKNTTDNVDYSSFEVIENIDTNKVTAIEYEEGTLSSDGKQIKWNVSSLGAGDSIEIYYTVKVNNEKSEGKSGSRSRSI